MAAGAAAVHSCPTAVIGSIRRAFSLGPAPFFADRAPAAPTPLLTFGNAPGVGIIANWRGAALTSPSHRSRRYTGSAAPRPWNLQDGSLPGIGTAAVVPA